MTSSTARSISSLAIFTLACGAELRVLLTSLEVMRRGVRLEGDRSVDALVGKQARHAHHPAVGLANALASHRLPTWALCLPYLRTAPFAGRATWSSAPSNSILRALTFRGSHIDSDKNHCSPCDSLRCVPTTG
jgi:hypothetical protein